MLITICITLYIIIKNAIEAEKAKSAKIENDLKLEIEKLKAELNAEEAKHDKTLFLANVVARYNKSIKKFETRTDISNFSTSSYMTDEEEEDNQSIESMYSTTSSTIDEGEQDNQSVKSMYSSSSTIDEDEELDELNFELELEKATNARFVSALKTLVISANYNEISTRFIEQVIINEDIETKFEYMKTKFDNEKKYNSELNDVIERLYAIINNRKFED
jgi:hypothetical protein